MGCLELSVPMNVYLGPEYKIQVPNVDCPNIRDKHFIIYKIYIYIYICAYKEVRYSVSVQINKTTTSIKAIKLEISTNPLHAMTMGREFLRQTNCRALG